MNMYQNLWNTIRKDLENYSEFEDSTYYLCEGGFSTIYINNEIVFKVEHACLDNFDMEIDCFRETIGGELYSDFVILADLSNSNSFVKLLDRIDYSITVMPYIKGKRLISIYFDNNFEIPEVYLNQIREAFRFAIQKGWFPYDNHVDDVFVHEDDSITIIDVNLYQRISYIKENCPSTNHYTIEDWVDLAMKCFLNESARFKIYSDYDNLLKNA